MLIRTLTFACTFALSMAFALYLTPFIRRGALTFGVLDKPDGVLKRHPAPVPYLGGIAVYLAFLLTLSIVFSFSKELLGLLLGGTMLAMLGLFDDLRVIAPRLKLAGQLLATWVMLRCDIAIQISALPQSITIPLTILWLVGVTNAMNILDVSDGLATGVAAIAALAFFVIAVLDGDLTMAVTALALVGALVGFLRYNQPQAQIYLGDTGSLFIGFMLSALAMAGAYAQHNEAALLAPIAILGVPILETTLVVFARLGRGRSPFVGSNDHLAARLKARGWSSREVLAFAYTLSLVGATGGVVVVVTELSTALVILCILATLFIAVLLWLLYACPPPLSEAEPTR